MASSNNPDALCIALRHPTVAAAGYTAIAEGPQVWPLPGLRTME